ncbi:hypothetical protein PINS_up000557 [Pythium insidiosum]|nr:hypothetical protein PINS_up000557 [Pythium insidiosum]
MPQHRLAALWEGRAADTARQMTALLKEHGFQVGVLLDDARPDSIPPSCSLNVFSQSDAFDNSSSVTISDIGANNACEASDASVDLSDPRSWEGLVCDILGTKRVPPPGTRLFGPIPIATSQVFYETPFSFGLVNLKPIVPGHVLVIPRRVVPRFESLHDDEVADLWKTAQRIGAQVQRHYQATALTFAIQDGRDAGQTVPHVHIHVLPRRTDDFARNDDVYTEIERHEQQLHMDADAMRQARSAHEMAMEATALRQLFTMNETG